MHGRMDAWTHGRMDAWTHENGRILIIEAKINDDNFIVINIYNSNTESEQLKTFSILQNMLDGINISNKQIVFWGDFNLIFDCKLETNDGNPVLKKKSLAKLIKINESLSLCDICIESIESIYEKNKKTLHILSGSGFWFHSNKTIIFFISNTLQDCVKKTDVFASFSTDHSPFFF